MANLDNLFKKISSMGLTVKKVSQDTGISSGNISDWKNGRSFPSALKLIDLANYLNCSTDFLLGRTETEKVINLPNEIAEEIVSRFNEEEEEFISEKDIIKYPIKKSIKLYSVNAYDYDKVIRIYDRVSEKYDKEKILISKKEYIELFEFQDGIMERYIINPLIHSEKGFYILTQKNYNMFCEIYKLYVKSFV